MRIAHVLALPHTIQSGGAVSAARNGGILSRSRCRRMPGVRGHGIVGGGIFFLPGNHDSGTPTNPCHGCVRRTGLWSSRGPRGAGHRSRSGGEDGAERPQARRSPPRVRSERLRASAEQLAGLGPGRAALRRREVSRARGPGLGSAGLTAGPGEAALVGAALRVGFAPRLWACSSRAGGGRPALAGARGWPRPGHRPRGLSTASREHSSLPALEVAGLATDGAEAGVRIWPREHFGSWPFPDFGQCFRYSTFAHDIHRRQKRGGADPGALDPA